MSAQPVHAPISYLQPVGADDFVDSGHLQRELATERSANKALLGALGDLEKRLAAERSRAAKMEGANTVLAARFAEAEELASSERDQVKRLWLELSDTRQVLANEYSKPLWRKALSRF